jgi:hypothetical protein
MTKTNWASLASIEVAPLWADAGLPAAEASDRAIAQARERWRRESRRIIRS